MSADLQELEAKLDYHFRERQLLVRALTHRSFSFDNPKGTVPLDNEQFEFLGDAVLGYLVSAALVQRFPSFPEGRLSEIKAQLVSAVHLYAVARRMELGAYLQIGRSEEMSGGRDKKGLLSDALEAVIAAVCLDGGIEAARSLVVRWIIPTDELDVIDHEEQNNYKSMLQERAQALKLPQPHYITLEESGPAHARTFTVEARVGPDRASRGSGPSKKAAAQDAARKLLDEIVPAAPGG